MINLYALFDKKAARYGTPFPSTSAAEACRGVIMGIRSGQPVFAKFPEDFAIYLVGQWDDVSATLTAQPPVHVSELVALVEANNG